MIHDKSTRLALENCFMPLTFMSLKKSVLAEIYFSDSLLHVFTTLYLRIVELPEFHQSDNFPWLLEADRK